MGDVDELLAPVRRRILVAETVRDLSDDVYAEVLELAELREVSPERYRSALLAFELRLGVRNDARHGG